MLWLLIAVACWADGFYGSSDQSFSLSEMEESSHLTAITDSLSLTSPMDSSVALPPPMDYYESRFAWNYHRIALKAPERIDVEQFLTFLEIVLPWKVPRKGTAEQAENLAWALEFKITLLKRMWGDQSTRRLLCYVHHEQFSKALLNNLLGHRAELEKLTGDEERQLMEPAYEVITLNYFEVLCQIYMAVPVRAPLFASLYGTPFFRGLFALLHTPDRREQTHVSFVINHAAQRILGGNFLQGYYVPTRYYSDFQSTFVNHVVPLIASDEYQSILDKYEEIVGAEIHAARKDPVYWRALTGSFIKSTRSSRKMTARAMKRLNLALQWYSLGKLAPEYHVMLFKYLLADIRDNSSLALQIAFLLKIGDPAFTIVFSSNRLYESHSELRTQVLRTIFVTLLHWTLDANTQPLAVEALDAVLDQWFSEPGLGELQSDPRIQDLLTRHQNRDMPKQRKHRVVLPAPECDPE
ncbi:hypothetical protein PSACC_01861 [Paramicrosporidium saccamoebae]|uniref:Uncharacterized protein n=1 Tax=Paramicrosporidium saccamoebae TaxID=1246581 RepID=A0A2H9TKQ1_9FUNG|nr:hypothetical protein PSACC_01861 [Paramicrosporidium saccamoebae]